MEAREDKERKRRRQIRDGDLDEGSVGSEERDGDRTCRERGEVGEHNGDE